MSGPTPKDAALEDWITREAIPFAIDAPDSVDAAVDAVLATLDTAVELLGFGEALHGGEALLLLRNRLFQRLVTAHGFSAIAIESSFPRGRVANAYVAGSGPDEYTALLDTGFSHGFGQLAANRELVEWMRSYNAAPAHNVKLQFYGFDQPAIADSVASPRQVLHFVLDYLAALGSADAETQRRRIDALLGADARWENPMAWLDPEGSRELRAAAAELRAETESLIVELRVGRPALVAASAPGRHAEALQYARMARELLNFYAALAGSSSFAGALGVRDALMADNLAYIVERERGRGKVLAFAHNSHLQRGQAEIQGGPDIFRWWPAGAQLDQLLGARYAVIGSAVGVSEANGIGQPEAGTLEAYLTAAPGPARFIPTHGGSALPSSTLEALPLRSTSPRNPSYTTPLNPQSFTDFDWLAVVDSTGYSRGGRQLPP